MYHSSIRKATPHESASDSSAAPHTTEQEWERHRKHITALYQGSSLTLKEVKSTMEAGHGFVASERMFKARFKAWGIGKNMTVEQVRKLLQSIQEGHQLLVCRQSTPAGIALAVKLINGDVLDFEKLRRYFKRKSTGFRKLKLQDQGHNLQLVESWLGGCDLKAGHVATLEPRGQLTSQQTPRHSQAWSMSQRPMLSWSSEEGKSLKSRHPSKTTDQAYDISMEVLRGSSFPSCAPTICWNYVRPGCYDPLMPVITDPGHWATTCPFLPTTSFAIGRG